MPPGLCLFVLHVLSTQLLPPELLRQIVATATRRDETVLQRCAACGVALLVLQGHTLAPTGVRYYVLDDVARCDACSGLRRRFEEYAARQRALGVHVEPLPP